MNLFFIKCNVDLDKASRIPVLRPAHLEHIKANINRINYGGIMDVQGESFANLVMFFEAEQESEVHSFIAADPYHEVYQSVEVKPFSRKV